MKSFWILGIVNFFNCWNCHWWVPIVWIVTVTVLQCKVFLLLWEREESWETVLVLSHDSVLPQLPQICLLWTKNMFFFFFLIPALCPRYLLLANQINKVSVFKELLFFSVSLVMPFQTLCWYNLYFLWPHF